MRILRVISGVITLLVILVFMFLSCGVPPDPFDKNKTKVSVLLKSSDGQENQFSILDSTDNTATVIVSIDLAQHFDSIITIVYQDDIQDYYFKFEDKAEIYATVIYPVTFSSAGNHQVTVTGYVEGLPNREARALIIIEPRQGLPPTNQPPKLIIGGRRTVIPGNTLSLSVTATDPDAGQVAIVSQVKLPAGATFSNDTLRWVPAADNLGFDTAIFAATDNGTPVLSTRDTVVITVSATAVNQPPVWSTTILQRTARLGTNSTLDLEDLCSDPDGDAITFTLLSGTPEGDTVIGTTWSYTPASSATASHLVKIVASDPSGETDTMVIDLTVSADAADVTPPTKMRISPVQDSQIVTTPGLEVKASFKDESGVDTVVCSMGEKSYEVTLSNDTLYSATVTILAPGPNSIRFIATDASPAANRCTLYVVVKYATVTSHTVTFDKNDAAATGTMAVQNIAEGTAAALSVNAFVKAGSSFTGWATSATGAVVYADAASYTMGTADVILYAKWAANTHKVTFDKNDAAATGTMAVQNITESTDAALSANAFVKAGSSFTGWATSSSGAVVYANAASYTMGTSDVTLYAKWVVNTHTVTFNKNDAAATGTMANQTIAEGVSAPLTANAFVKTGSTFTGWATSAAGAVEYTDAESYTMGTGDVTLYAKWAVKTHTVTFDKNDAAASGTMANQTISEGASAPLTANAFTKSGWTFDGWATSATGAKVYANAASYTMGTADVTLYAKWIQKTHTVTFNKNDAAASGSMSAQTIPEGNSVPVTANGFSKAGWNFDGWATSATGTATYADGDDYTMGTADVTLYAKWSAKSLSVIFNKNDATATGSMTNQSILSGSSMPLKPNSFMKSGWTFAGWATTPSGSKTYDDQASYTMGTADVTLYAKWTLNSYSLAISAATGGRISVPTISSITVSHGVQTTITAVANTGYNFTSWTSTNSASIANPNDSNTTVTLTGNATITANFSRITCTVSFNSQSIITSTQSVNYGGYATEINLTRACCDYGGWFKDSMCTIPWRFNIDQVIGNTTLYCKWTVSQIVLSHPSWATKIDICINDPINVGAECAVKYEWYGDSWGMGEYFLLDPNSATWEGQGTSTLRYINGVAGCNVYCIVTDQAGRQTRSGEWSWGIGSCP